MSLLNRWYLVQVQVQAVVPGSEGANFKGVQKQRSGARQRSGSTTVVVNGRTEQYGYLSELHHVINLTARRIHAVHADT